MAGAHSSGSRTGSDLRGSATCWTSSRTTWRVLRARTHGGGTCSRMGARASYANFFDIHWDEGRRPSRGRVLVPVLEQPYGATLEGHDIHLERRDGAFVAIYRGRALSDIAVEHQLAPRGRRRGCTVDRPDQPGSGAGCAVLIAGAGGRHRVHSTGCTGPARRRTGGDLRVR